MSDVLKSILQWSLRQTEKENKQSVSDHERPARDPEVSSLLG